MIEPHALRRILIIQQFRQLLRKRIVSEILAMITPAVSSR